MNYQAEINIQSINTLMPRKSDKIRYLTLIYKDFRNMVSILDEGVLSEDFSIFSQVRHCLVPFLRQLKVHSLADQFENIREDNWLFEVHYIKININDFINDLKYIVRGLEIR